MSNSTDAKPLTAAELAEIRHAYRNCNPDDQSCDHAGQGLLYDGPEGGRKGDDMCGACWASANMERDVKRLLATIDSLTARLEAPEQMMEATLNADGSTTVKRLACKNCERSSEITCINCGKASGEHFCHGLDTPGCYSMNYKVEAAEAARKP